MHCIISLAQNLMNRVLPAILKVLSFGRKRVLKSLENKSKVQALFTTIGFSHYSERARWALDHSPLHDKYVESRHVPAFHLSETLLLLSKLPRLVLFWRGNQVNRVFSKEETRKEKTGVPKLTFAVASNQEYNRIESSARKLQLLDGDKYYVLADGSTGILRYLYMVYGNEDKRMKALYMEGAAEDEIHALEKLLTDDFAPAVSAWIFGNILLTGDSFYSKDKKVNSSDNVESVRFFVDSCYRNEKVSWMERIAFRILGEKFIVPLMVKHNAVTAQNRDNALLKIESVLREFDARLERKSTSAAKEQFLIDSSELPSAADITFASFCLPILLPSESKELFTSLEDVEEFLRILEGNNKRTEMVAPGLVQLVKTARRLLKDHPSARYAIDLYRKHRLLISQK